MMKNIYDILSTNEPLYRSIDEYTVVVFGAGNTSVLYQKCFELEGIKPVYYLDNNASKQDTVFQGVSVISVEKLVALQPSFIKPVIVLICSAQIVACDQIKLQLKKFGFTYTTIDAFVFAKNKEKIQNVYESLADDLSKKIYMEMIKARLNNSYVIESIVSNETVLYTYI